MLASSRRRIGAFGLLTIVIGLLIALLAKDSASDANAATAQPTSARPMLLRSADLPAGYRYFSPNWDGQPNPDVHCAALAPADTTPEIDAWIAASAPRGCYALFTRLRIRSYENFRIIPPLIGTGALDAGSVESAETGLDLAGLLLTVGLDKRVGPTQPAPAGPGDEAVYFRFKSGLSHELSGGGPRTSVLVWRSGDRLGVVLVGGLDTAAANDRKALVYAKRQQQRILAP